MSEDRGLEAVKESEGQGVLQVEQTKETQTDTHYSLGSQGERGDASPTCQLALCSETYSPVASHCINQASVPLPLPSPDVPTLLLPNPKSAGQRPV